MTNGIENNLRNIFLATLASAAMLALAAAPAQAAGVAVKVASHELLSAEGRAAVEARVEHAARMVCSSGTEWKDLRARANYRACVASAMESGKTRIADLRASSQMASR
ncbi:UrcA family protein [Sandaracinobacteroides sp. A072]|uniref:UrcA family protein n=1 Tax=Sandaracinobacteroides sp. A072 TaxID=3461146 RepID=UPI0040433ED9